MTCGGNAGWEREGVHAHTHTHTHNAVQCLLAWLPQAAGLDTLAGREHSTRRQPLPGSWRLRALFALLDFDWGAEALSEAKEAALHAEEVIWCRTSCGVSQLCRRHHATATKGAGRGGAGQLIWGGAPVSFDFRVQVHHATVEEEDAEPAVASAALHRLGCVQPPPTHASCVVHHPSHTRPRARARYDAAAAAAAAY